MLLTSCKHPSDEGGNSLPYSLNQPDKRLHLNAELMEISGLSWGDDGILYAVQDEKGLLFSLDTENGSVLERQRFYKDGDFEGLELVGNEIWVVKSNGNLHRKVLGEKGLAKKYKTLLSKKNNVEGLCYDAGSNCLWLACKESAQKDWGDNVRIVWAFSLESLKMHKDPVIVLKLKEQKAMGRELGLSSSRTFAPSGIAIHPTSRDIYLLSHAQSSLTVLDGNGTLKSVHALSHAGLAQPEGICFAPDGTLYIASEGGNGKPSVINVYQ